MNHRLIVLGAATGLFLFLAGCGGDSTNPGGDGGNDAGVASDTGSPTDGGGQADSGGNVDSGDNDSAAPDSGSPWDPSKLGSSALVVWLDAAKGVTQSNNAVSAWADQSGNNNNAAQATQARQPLLVANVINGKPVMRFDGTNQQYFTIADAASLRWGTGDFTVMEVTAWTNTASTNDNTGYGALWVKVGPNTPFPGASLFANNASGPTGAARAQVTINLFAASANTNLNNGSFRVVGMRRAGTTLEVRVGGAQAGMVANATTNIDAMGVSVFIGGREGNGAKQMLKGDIAEVIGVKGALSDPDLASLEGYLKAKYAL